jgi:hypothetical protein
MGPLRSGLMGVLVLFTLTSAVHAQTRGGFDTAGRMLMHGTPRFVLGVYDSGGSYSTDPALWEQQIFSPTGSRGLQGFPLNVYLNYWLGGMPIAPTTSLLDVLHTHGMMYLQTGNCFADGSWTRYGPGSFSIMSQSYVAQFAQHPAALGYYVMDECADALIAETEQHDQELHAWDPPGVTLATTLAAGYRDPGLWRHAADVLATDPYPLYGPEPAAGYTHFIVADFVSKLRAAAEADRPVWSVLQFFKFTTDSRLPTPDELRAHAVMSVVEGAQGIFWWDIGVNGLRKLDADTVSTYMGHLKTLTTELAGLEPALLAGPANAALIGNSTKFADPIAGRIAQLDHNIAVEWLYSRKEWYQAEKTALQAGDTSKSGGMLNGAAGVRTLTKVVDGVGYVFAYNYTNASQPVTFTWHIAPASVAESKTGQTFPLSGASWSDTFGPYQARIYVLQGAGIPPVEPVPTLALAFTSPESGATVSGTTPVALAATGGTGYAYTVSVDGTTVYTGPGNGVSWNTTTVADGAHTLAATVSDVLGRVATASRTVTVSNAPPPATGFTVTFSYPAGGATVSGNQTVGLSTTAPWGQAKTFTLSVDGTVLTSQSLTGTTLWYTWDTTKTANGGRTLTAAVAMNGSTATATLPVTVRNTLSPLIASFTAPAAGATLGGTTTVAMASSGASGSSTFTLAVDGSVVSTQTVAGAAASYTWNTTTVGNGARTLTLTVTDAAARTATASLTVSVSNLPPLTAAFTAPVPGATVGGTATIAMAASGASGSSTFTLAVDGTVVSTQTVTAATAAYAWDTTKAANGARALSLTTTDGAGRTATASLTLNVVNLPPLAVSFTAPSSGETVGGTTAIGLVSAGASGSSTFRLSVDGVLVSTQTVTGSTASYAWNTATAANGSHLLAVSVSDGAGRTATASRTVTVSNTAGLAAWFTDLATGAILGGVPTLGMATTAKAGPPRTFTLWVDGTAVMSATTKDATMWYTWDTTKVASGVHRLKLAVTLKGGTATTTILVTVSNP